MRKFWLFTLGMGVGSLVSQAEVMAPTVFRRPQGLIAEFGKPPAPLCLRENCQRGEDPETSAPPLGSFSRETFSISIGAQRGPASESSHQDVSVSVPPQKSTSGAQEQGALRAREEISVIVTEEGFLPRSFSVVVGNTVHLTLTTSSSVPLCFRLKDFGVYAQVTLGKIQTLTFTPSQAGTFPFDCPIQGLKGMLWVREWSRSEPPVPLIQSEKNP